MSARAFVLACRDWTSAIAHARADYQRAPNRACHVDACHELLTDAELCDHPPHLCACVIPCRRCLRELRRQASNYMREQHRARR